MDNDQDAIWAEMPDGGLLHDLFGHWPTFHDALVRSIEFDPSQDQVRLVLDYADEPTDGDQKLEVRIQLVWTGVISLDLPLQGTDLTRLSFKRKAGEIHTELEFNVSTVGLIRSESVDASITLLDPGPDSMRDQPLQLIYRRRR